MKEGQQSIKLKNYKPLAYKIEECNLFFKIEKENTVVSSVLFVKNMKTAKDLVLDRDSYSISQILLNDEDILKDVDILDNEKLTISNSLLGTKDFTLRITNTLNPRENTSLSGLYVSDGIFCTQCEAEGFRKITPFLDRPDNLSKYKVSIEASKSDFPYLLSNGNLVETKTTGDLEVVTWEDPFPKPSYLFALVAGDFDLVTDEFITKSGNSISLEIYSNRGDKDQCDHAMKSLKDSMKWDEDVFGLEYDLGRYMIVSVNSFNAGAMENKGLNIFNSALTLSKPETATDDDYSRIQGVIGHEYFHNWTGNRVTCRDWFQLTLKEGLTVFRDQEFSSDLNVRSIERLKNVAALIAAQYTEDSGPMAHPIRPEEYVEIDNFYTATVYQKGSEVIRMIHTLIGKENFRKGMDLYFELHDGKAVTTEDFVEAMEKVSGRDLSQFKKWYSQIGTPVVRTQESYDEKMKRLTLRVEQSNKHPKKETKNLHIPLLCKIFGENGEVFSKEKLIEVKKDQDEFVFENCPSKPIVSLNRGFTAPIILKREMNLDQKWKSCLVEDDVVVKTQLMREISAEEFSQGKFSAHWDRYIEDVFHSTELHSSEKAILLTPSGLNFASMHLQNFDFETLSDAHDVFKRKLALALEEKSLNLVKSYDFEKVYDFNAKDVGERDLFNLAINNLGAISSKENTEILINSFSKVKNMTDQENVLMVLCHNEISGYESSLESFYQSWKKYSTVVLKWLKANSSLKSIHVFDKINSVVNSERFDIKVPNHIYALVRYFASANLAQFHRKDGQGYKWVADQVLKIDSVNPAVAARVAKCFQLYSLLKGDQKEVMGKELRRINGTTGISKNTLEFIKSALKG